MNYKAHKLVKKKLNSFRPQQGLTIMNWLFDNFDNIVVSISFRPQQGLTIMNMEDAINAKIKFPSPTGVNYYESLPTKP